LGFLEKEGMNVIKGVRRSSTKELISLFCFRVNINIQPNCSHVIKSYCDNFDKVNAKLAFFMEDIQYTTRNSFCQGAGIKLKNFKKEATLSVLFTLRNSFLYDTINNIMEKTVPAGIPQYLIKYHEFNMFKVFVPSASSPVRVLTIQDLEYGFVIWLGACGISIIGFLLEVMLFNVEVCFKNFMGLWIVITIFRNKLRTLYLYR